MKPVSFTISKNVLIIAIIVLFGSVITYDQIKIRKQEAMLKSLQNENISNLEPKSQSGRFYIGYDTEYFNCDSIMESNKLLKKKVDYYFEFYRKHFPPNKN